MRFNPNNKLITKAEFKSVFDESFKVSQKFLTVLYKPNKKNQARIGLVVAKRSVNSAVARNQIKRVIRESFRLNQEKLAGLDIIVIARQQCGSLDKATLREGIEKLWEKLIKQYKHSSP